jgi:hypothetical protein
MPSLLTLSDVMGTGHHAALKANVRPGKVAAVVGDGAVGLCGVTAARRLGAEQIIMLGRHADRIALARRFGATDVVSERGDAAIERVCELLPELKTPRDKIQAERTERLIRFRGKCALSTGIALGAAFPAVGGWTFEIPQPPAKDPWRSDAGTTKVTDLLVELVDGGGTDLVLGLNIRGDGRDDIRSYINDTGNPPRFFAFMALKAPGSQSIAGAEEAGAFALAVREQLGQLLKAHGIKRTRLFFYGPFALAVFLGQQLTSVGEIQLFEYQDPGYVPSCTLRT